MTKLRLWGACLHHLLQAEWLAVRREGGKTLWLLGMSVRDERVWNWATTFRSRLKFSSAANSLMPGENHALKAILTIYLYDVENEFTL